jgi:hypothetical protein
MSEGIHGVYLTWARQWDVVFLSVLTLREEGKHVSNKNHCKHSVGSADWERGHGREWAIGSYNAKRAFPSFR